MRKYIVKTDTNYVLIEREDGLRAEAFRKGKQWRNAEGRPLADEDSDWLRQVQVERKKAGYDRHRAGRRSVVTRSLH